SGTKDAANQEVKKNESSRRYILLPNWTRDALLESTSKSSSQVPKGIGNPNSTASAFNPSAEKMKTQTVESPIPTVSLPVPTACLNDSSETSSEARLVSKRVANQEETPSLDNILSLTNRFDDILGVSTSSDDIIGVEADVSNMETSISASPTPTHRIHKDHPKSQITGAKHKTTVGNKMHKAFPLPVMKFPMPKEVPTASEESSHCQKKRDATAEKIALLLKSSSNCQSKSYDSYAKLVPHV
nr:hypothetical protein [Tanacetum cinerariifolium]